jgi:hypothetical protein
MDNILLIFVGVAAHKSEGSQRERKHKVQDKHHKRHGLLSSIVFCLGKVLVYQWSHWKRARLNYNLLGILLLRLSLVKLLLRLLLLLRLHHLYYISKNHHFD